MRYDSGQFGSMDSRDTRKTIVNLFRRMGRGLPEDIAGARRAGFLQGLLNLSTGFLGRPMIVEPCTALEAYWLFIAITGCLYVPIEEAAKKLEEVVRRLERGTSTFAVPQAVFDSGRTPHGGDGGKVLGG